MDSWGREIRAGGFVKEFVKANLKPSRELSYVIGVLKGDGTIYINPDKWCYKVQLSVTDKPFAKKFKEYLEEIGLNPCIYPKERNEPNRKKQFMVVACSRHFVEWYENMDLEDKRKKVEGNEEYFIKGMYDSEGSLDVRERKHRNFPQTRLVIINTDKKILKLIQKMLLGMDIKSKVVSWHKPPEKDYKEVFALKMDRNMDVVKFLKEIDSNISRKSYSELRKHTKEEPKEVMIHSAETYNEAIKLHKEKGLGSPKISKILDIPQTTVGGWIYMGTVPPSAKGGGGISH